MHRVVIEARKIISLMKVKDTFTIPVSLFAIADLARVKMVEYPFQSVEGFLFVYKGEKSLTYDSMGMKPRMRFTLAHEIGHAVLNHQISCVGGIDTGRSRFDQEADRFAEEVLMPEREFRHHYENQFSDLPPDERPAALARMFNVSRQAAEIRVRRLGLAG